MNIIVICTGNSARSILAEALINHLGQGRYHAYSAGSKPTGIVNPLALASLALIGIQPTQPRSKSWDEFLRPDAPKLALTITVCDNAAGEACPLFLGAPHKIHWGHADPAAAQGSWDEKLAVFNQVRDALRAKIEVLVAQPPAQWQTPAGLQLLKSIGEATDAQ